MSRILVVAHDSPPEPDMAQRHVAGRGAEVVSRRPFLGDPLPELSEIDGMIVLGGPQMVPDAAEEPWLQAEAALMREGVAAGVPVLGICLGGQILSHALGGAVGPHPDGMVALGWNPIRSADPAIPDGLVALQGNAQGFSVPPGARLAAEGAPFRNQAFRAGPRAWGLQFHPEVTPAILEAWIAEMPEGFDKPGAGSLEDLRDGMERHDPALKAWMRGFLDGLFQLV